MIAKHANKLTKEVKNVNRNAMSSKPNRLSHIKFKSYTIYIIEFKFKIRKRKTDGEKTTTGKQTDEFVEPYDLHFSNTNTQIMVLMTVYCAAFRTRNYAGIQRCSLVHSHTIGIHIFLKMKKENKQTKNKSTHSYLQSKTVCVHTSYTFL